MLVRNTRIALFCLIAVVIYRLWFTPVKVYLISCIFEQILLNRIKNNEKVKSDLFLIVSDTL